MGQAESSSHWIQTCSKDTFCTGSYYWLAWELTLDTRVIFFLLVDWSSKTSVKYETGSRNGKLKASKYMTNDFPVP